MATYSRGAGEVLDTLELGAGAADPQTELPKPTLDAHWHLCKGHQYVRITAQITDDANDDFAEFRIWTKDGSGVGAPQKMLGGTGLFRATKLASPTENDAVSETFHITGATYYAVECTQRTDAAVRCIVHGTLCNDP